MKLSKHETKRITKRIDEATASLDKLEEDTKTLASLLKATPQGLVNQLLWCLQMATVCFRMRSSALSASDDVSRATSEVHFSESMPSSIRRSSGSGERTADVCTLKVCLAREQDYLKVIQLANRLSELLDFAETSYVQCQTVFPDYDRKTCCYGGREAYSLLKLWESGKLGTILADEDSLFGWHACSRHDEEKWKRAVRKVRRMLRISRKSGSKPLRKGRHRRLLGVVRWSMTVAELVNVTDGLCGWKR